MIEYNPRESTEKRQKKAQRRLMDKVAVLELWHQVGAPPDGYPWPKRIGEFLAWEDADFKAEVLWEGEKTEVNGIYKLSAVTADKPQNLSLKERAIELIGHLHRATKPSSIRAEEKRLKAELSQALAELQTITNKFIELRAEMLEVGKSSRLKDNRIANLQEENSKLLKKLATLTTFQVVPDKGGEVV